MISSSKGYLPYVMIVMCWCALFFNDIYQQPIDLIIDGPLPYGLDQQTLLTTLQSHTSFKGGVEYLIYDFFNKTGHYHHIEVKRTYPQTILVTLKRKKLLALWNHDQVLLDDGSVMNAYGKEKSDYHIEFKSISDHYKDNLKSLLTSLNQRSIAVEHISVAVSGTITLSQNTSTIILPSHQSLNRFNRIWAHYNNQWPNNTLIDARYEAGFVFKKKQSARI